MKPHIRSLALDAGGNLLAGTEPSGRILRIPKAAANRRAFVLYETSRKEITRAAVGREWRPVRCRGWREALAPNPGQPRSHHNGCKHHVQFCDHSWPRWKCVTGGATQSPLNPFTPLPTVNSSSVYRIAADGSPEELWSSRDDVVYSLGLLPNGNILLGTGNDGAVLELQGNHIFSKLLKAPSRQITAIAAGPGGKLYLAAANPGMIFSLGPENDTEGSYESQPFDAHIFSRWGRTQWLGENIAAAGNGGVSRVAVYARSGNTSDPDSNWSDWSGPYSNPAGDKLDCPAARFVQWKTVLARRGAGGPAPTIALVKYRVFAQEYCPGNNCSSSRCRIPGVRVQ